MRMKLIMAFVFVPMALLATHDVSDVQLRQILNRAIRYEDNPHASWGEVRYAIQCAGGNSNRVVSLMKQLVSEGTEDEAAAMFYISEIGKYGTNSDLPFLYQRVAATNLCEAAAGSVIRIEGLTTNSLAQISALAPAGLVDPWVSMGAWCRILEAAEACPTNALIRAQAVSNAVSYAARLTSYVETFDGCITHVDSSYRMSKRRLSVLRSVRDLGPNEWQTNFVTRAIHELESCPEANLSE